MNNEFQIKFSTYLNSKSYTLIPTKEKYESIIETIMKKTAGEFPKSLQEQKLMSRYKNAANV